MRKAPTLSRELLPPGSSVLCAVSGGADSVCLLSLAHERGDLTVLCAHYDHGIRGEESRRDADFTAALCRKWDIPLCTERGDVPGYAREHGIGIEEAARALRYAFLERTAAETGADFIATAHTLDDNAETVLLHLLRGTGLRGLGGIAPRRGRIVRPLLGVSRAEVEAYLRENGIEWVEDSTNATDDYERNRVRHHVLPAMEAVRPGAADRLARMTATLREDEEYLQSLADGFLANSGDALPVHELSRLPKSVARRVVRTWAGVALSPEQTDAVLALSDKSPSAAADVPGVHIRRENDLLWKGRAEEPVLSERVIPVPGELALPECGLRLTSEETVYGTEIQNSFNTFFFSCDNICGKLTVGARSEGDSIRLAGREGTHKVKKLLTDAKIPRTRRGALPVLRDEAGILAVYGIGQAQRSLPKSGETCIRIEIKEMSGDSENEE